jgi:hypothetical protein
MTHSCILNFLSKIRVFNLCLSAVSKRIGRREYGGAGAGAVAAGQLFAQLGRVYYQSFF